MRKSEEIFPAAVLLGIMAIFMPAPVFAGALNSPGSNAGSTRINYTRPERSVPKPERAVTPYGDFCTRCSKYGMGKRPVNISEAIAAMETYFMSKGLKVRDVKGRGRFLKADIYKDKFLVDRVLFDRRTGRLRSIY